MVEILCHVAADPEQREEIELEWRSREFLEEFIKQELVLQKQAIEEKDKALEEKDKALEEKDKVLDELKKQVANIDEILELHTDE